MTEENKDESWFSLLSQIRKVHPVILIIGFALMNVFAVVVHSQMQFHLKFFALVSIGFFYLLAVFYEFYRIEKEKELKEKGLS